MPRWLSKITECFYPKKNTPSSSSATSSSFSSSQVLCPNPNEEIGKATGTELRNLQLSKSTGFRPLSPSQGTRRHRRQQVSSEPSKLVSCVDPKIHPRLTPTVCKVNKLECSFGHRMKTIMTTEKLTCSGKCGEQFNKGSILTKCPACDYFLCSECACLEIKRVEHPRQLIGRAVSKKVAGSKWVGGTVARFEDPGWVCHFYDHHVEAFDPVSMRRLLVEDEARRNKPLLNSEQQTSDEGRKKRKLLAGKTEGLNHATSCILKISRCRTTMCFGFVVVDDDTFMGVLVESVLQDSTGLSPGDRILAIASEAEESELSWAEVSSVREVKAHAIDSKSIIVKILRGNSNRLPLPTANAKVSVQTNIAPQVSEVSMVGAKFNKLFPGHGVFSGKVIYEHPHSVWDVKARKKARTFRVVYSEDGDSEDLSYEELLELGVQEPNCSEIRIGNDHGMQVLSVDENSHPMCGVCRHQNLLRTPNCTKCATQLVSPGVRLSLPNQIQNSLHPPKEKKRPARNEVLPSVETKKLKD